MLGFGPAIAVALSKPLALSKPVGAALTLNGIVVGVRSVDFSYVAGPHDHVILCDSTPGPISVFLPDDSRRYIIKKISGDANTVTIWPRGVKPIPLRRPYESIELEKA